MFQIIFFKKAYKNCIKSGVFIAFFSFCNSVIAQGVTNFGNLHLFGGGNMGTTVPFTNNAAAGTDYINDGSFYTTSNFINNKAAMPAGTGNTIFYGTNTQSISGTNTPQFYNITINNTVAALQPLQQNFTFNVAGNWINNGVYRHNNGTVVFNGSTLSSISGTANKTTFYNFTLQNPASLLLSQNVDLLNIFAFKDVSNTSLLANGFLTAKSSDTLTAQIADLTNGGLLSGNSVVGNVTVERYLFPRLAWRFLATPISLVGSQTIAQSWRENNASLSVSTGFGTRITGPTLIGPNGLDEYTQRGSMKFYNSVTDNFTEISNTSFPIANNQGYFVFVRGDRSVPVGSVASATTLRMTGNIRMNNQVFNVLPNKFESFGNPYASRINVASITKSNVVDAITIWNPNNVGLYNVGGYETYVNVLGEYWLNGITTGPTAKKRNFIESGEAVFIQSVTGGNITVKEVDKNAGSSLVSRNIERNQNVIPTIDVNLLIRNTNFADSATLVDGVSVSFDENYRNNIDNDDVKKISNNFDNLTILKNTHNLAVERRPNPINNDTLQLRLNGTRVNNYKFIVTPSLLQNIEKDVFFVDKFLNIMLPINLIQSTEVLFNITNNAASREPERFYILFKNANVLPFSFNDINVFKDIANNQIKFSVTNERRITQYVLEKADYNSSFITANSISPAHYANGYYHYQITDTLPQTSEQKYRVKAIDIYGNIYYSDIVTLREPTLTTESNIMVNPNPVHNKHLNLFTKNLIGKYALSVFAMDGKMVLSTNITLSQINELKSINLGKGISTGTYILQLKANKFSERLKIYIE